MPETVAVAVAGPNEEPCSLARFPDMLVESAAGDCVKEAVPVDPVEDTKAVPDSMVLEEPDDPLLPSSLLNVTSLLKILTSFCCGSCCESSNE